MTLNETGPSFEAAYAETMLVDREAGLEEADLSYLTIELFEELLASEAGAGITSVADTEVAGLPGGPVGGELVHHAIFLGGDRVIGYQASATGGCQTLVPVDTRGFRMPVRTCAPGGVTIWKIVPV
jgi:hypothetical protein